MRQKFKAQAKLLPGKIGKNLSVQSQMFRWDTVRRRHTHNCAIPVNDTALTISRLSTFNFITTLYIWGGGLQRPYAELLN